VPRLSVLNAGIGGNRILQDGFTPNFGPSALSRLDADAIRHAGVTDVIVMEGTNDLGFPPAASAEQVIAALTQIVGRLHAAGLNVLLGTLAPSKGVVLAGLHGLPPAVAARNEINQWIRSQHVADGVVDFNAALRDPDDPDALRPAYDSSDHLHPNTAGYQAMADAVDPTQLRGARCQTPTRRRKRPRRVLPDCRGRPAPCQHRGHPHTRHTPRASAR
jgi:lysophospholipase L1-like esterase